MIINEGLSDRFIAEIKIEGNIFSSVILEV